MIKRIDIKINAVTIYFEAKYNGIFSCFEEKVILKNSNRISLKYRDDIVYDNNFKFKPDGGEEVAIAYDGINFFDHSVTQYVGRKAFRSPETIFFIARNIANHHDQLMKRCNSAVVLSYRAIELDNKDVVFYSLGLVNTLLASLALELGRKQTAAIKSNPEHVFISLQYVKSLLSLYLCDEVSFVDSLNVLVNIPRKTPEKVYLPYSYFSLILVHKLIASYIGRELSFLIFDESLHLSKECYDGFVLGRKHTRTRTREISQSISQLSSLAAYRSMEDLDEKEFFIKALRCVSQEKLYSNFKKFKKTRMVYLKPLSSINRLIVDIIKNKAIHLEKEGDIESALNLIKSVLMARPNSVYFRKKYIQYIQVLNQSEVPPAS